MGFKHMGAAGKFELNWNLSWIRSFWNKKIDKMWRKKLKNWKFSKKNWKMGVRRNRNSFNSGSYGVEKEVFKWCLKGSTNLFLISRWVPHYQLLIQLSPQLKKRLHTDMSMICCNHGIDHVIFPIIYQNPLYEYLMWLSMVSHAAPAPSPWILRIYQELNLKLKFGMQGTQPS